ncbi:hypothetical protein D3C86_1727610 [compost metagenome]
MRVVAYQGEILGARLVQANGIAIQATGFGDHVPDIRIVRASFQQACEGFLRIGRAVLLEQQVNAHLIEWIVAGI